MHLEESAWTDVAEAEADLALLPVGSIEQHGPHAPLATDCVTASTVARRAASATTQTVLVGPTIPIGIAEEHRAFPGTLWVRPDTFRGYVRETIESLAAHGVARIVIVNGHGGNVAALREISDRLTRDQIARVVPFTWFEAIDVEGVTMGHGGPIETAAVWAVHPELIEQDRLESARAEGADRWGEWVDGVNIAVDTDEFSENGVVGDPTDASPELGDRILEQAVEALQAVMAAVRSRPVRRP